MPLLRGPAPPLHGLITVLLSAIAVKIRVAELILLIRALGPFRIFRRITGSAVIFIALILPGLRSSLPIRIKAVIEGFVNRFLKAHGE